MSAPAPASASSRLLRRTSSQPAHEIGQEAPAAAANAVRVMIVDDSLTVRTIFKRMVESDGSMLVAGTASSAERAIAQVGELDVDVMLLDLEMPGMGGLQALPAILKAAPKVQILVVSSLTEDGAEATVKALSTGAADTMLKPRPGGFNEDYRSQLLGKIRALGGANGQTGEVEQSADPRAAEKSSEFAQAKQSRSLQPEVLAIGASTGGIHALNVMLRNLTADFDLPILITQHLPSSFIPVFARQIEVASGRRTHIAEDGTEIRAGEVAIATGHGHMVVRRIGDRLVTRTSAKPARSGCMPSVDPMLTSLSESCEGRVLAVILSGMGRDGHEGAQALVKAGGAIWAQDAETSAVWGMPGAVAKAGLTSLVAAPDVLGNALMDQFASANGNPVKKASN